MTTTALDLAQRFVGVKEIPGNKDNPMILSMLKLDGEWPEHDEVPWCSAFINYIAWLLRLPRSKSLRARSWLNVGTVVPLQDMAPGFDIIILKRGGGKQPGAEVLDAPGHVGLYAGTPTERTQHIIPILGGNQGDTVSVKMYDSDRILGVRRLSSACT